jgi:VanZ family protein
MVLLALMLVGGIAYATLCPIGMRPHLASADEERFGAYFVMGGVVALAFPRRWLSVTLFVAVLAVSLEAGQLLIPGRDARVSDALVKTLGGVLGAQTGFGSFAARRLIARLVQKRRPLVAAVDQDL